MDNLHCSSAYVQRICFAVAGLLCPLYNLPMVPGRHTLPLWNKIQVENLAFRTVMGRFCTFFVFSAFAGCSVYLYRISYVLVRHAHTAIFALVQV